jgi:hypothetical protein
VMDKSDWHNRLLAITLEDSWFAPIKEIVKMNTIQYQGESELYSFQQQKSVKVNPQDLRRMTMQFKLTDGQTPTEKLVNFQVLSQGAQRGMAIPAINAEYDIPGMLIYSFKTQGAYWLDQFKRTPEQQQQYLQLANQTANANADPKNQAEAKQVANTPPQLPGPSQ